MDGKCIRKKPKAMIKVRIRELQNPRAQRTSW